MKIADVPLKVWGIDYAGESDYGVATYARVTVDGIFIEMILQEGEPCDHVGCLNHITHPCEGCGRIAGRLDTLDPNWCRL